MGERDGDKARGTGGVRDDRRAAEIEAEREAVGYNGHALPSAEVRSGLVCRELFPIGVAATSEDAQVRAAAPAHQEDAKGVVGVEWLFT